MLEQPLVPYDEEPADDVVVAAKVFRAAVDDEVCAEFERALEIAGEKRVVDDEKRVVRVSELGERAQVRDFHGGVRGRLDEECGNAFLAGGLDSGEVPEIDGPEIDAVA